MITNYDRELGSLDTRISQMEKRFDKLEIENNQKLKDIKEQNEKLETKINDKFESVSQKLDDLKDQSTYSKGFLKAIFLIGTIIAFIAGLGSRFLFK